MPPSPRRRLRAALVLTVQGALAMGCEGACPRTRPSTRRRCRRWRWGAASCPRGGPRRAACPAPAKGRPATTPPTRCTAATSSSCGRAAIGPGARRARWRATRPRPTCPACPTQRLAFDAWRPEDVPPDDVPRPDDAAPPTDVTRACPLTRPAERAACEPEAVLPECRYPSLDALCPAGSSDVVVCDPVARWWRWSPTACRTNPCPAALPAELSACSPSASTPCAYTQPCGGSLSIRVWAFCMLYRDNRVWLHRFPDGLCDGGL
jgi:hypothetical protein